MRVSQPRRGGHPGSRIGYEGRVEGTMPRNTMAEKIRAMQKLAFDLGNMLREVMSWIETGLPQFRRG
jgi:hypothetical protein